MKINWRKVRTRIKHVLAFGLLCDASVHDCKNTTRRCSQCGLAE